MWMHCVKCVDFNKLKIIENWNHEKPTQLQCYVKWLDYNKYNKINW
jgi:hypothetical protein